MPQTYCGVSIDLIHEWDYLTWLFGFPDEVCNFRGKYSDLEIDSDDHSVYIAKYPDKQISLSLDYFGRIERREIELSTPTGSAIRVNPVTSSSPITPTVLV